MACQVEQIGDCGDISTLARALFILDKDDNAWLTQCPLSLSSCGTLLAVGYRNRLCLLTAQWISSLEANNYLISWNGTLSTDITAVLTLPLCPTQSSSQNGPDWLCIIVGFKNGAVGFYTHTGHLLFMEKFDDKPVLKLSCHTATYGTLPDDINVLYQNCQCVISGASLFPTLRYAKAQLARVQAGVLSDYTVDSNSVSVKKWTFSEQECINDACVVGLELKNTYDHLLAASTYGGYDAWYRSVPPANTLILGAGSKPYVGFHYALEGGSAPPLQDVARAVANRIKSALPGWLGGGTEAPNRPEPRLRAEPLSMRAGLHDSRQGTLLALSPDRRLAAVSDSVGRVTVLDVARGHAVRLFKGCRDAQCAFVQVFEQDSKKPQLSTIKGTRRALFLIIYNPKKGLVDIRLMMRGTRVAVFTATKNGVLVYNTCGLVGAEQNYMNKRLNLPEMQCVLIDPDGKLKKFNIPFYFALEGENSERSKDLHILRELRDYLKRTSKTDYDKNEILKKAAELNTLDLKKHCLEMLVRNYTVKPQIIMECLKIFWDNTADNESNNSVLNIKQYFSNLALVTLFYLKINNADSESMSDLIESVHKHLNRSDVDEKESLDENNELNFKLLVDDDCILERLLMLAQEKDYKDHQHARVTFADNLQNTYKDFIAVFDLENESTQINLKSDVSTEKTSTLASYVFKLLFKIKDLSSLTDFVVESNIDVKDIVKLLIIHIMNMNLEDINLELIEKFIKVLYYLCRSSQLTSKISYNEISDWWQSIRDILVDMPCPLRSMIVAMACKSVAQNFETKTSEEAAWESVTKENAKWGILIGKLEDISILSIILHLKETYKGVCLPKLYGADFDVNLKLIYTKGKGSVTELIAKWLCSMGVPPEAIIANELMDKVTEATDNQDDDTDALFLEDHKDLVDENPRIFKWLSLLRQQFPLSTCSDYILVNMCWEYAKSWQKSVKELEKFKAVVACLKNIGDHHLRLGVCTLVWTAHVKHTFESACRLVNKVGKLPKEILCLQDVGFSDVQMVKFLEIATTYLGSYFEYSTKNLHKTIMKVQFEKIWEESVPSLIEVALETKRVNIDILNLTYQISLTIYYQCHFNIKVNKPLNNLFDVEYHFIFENLTESGKPLNLRPSEKLKSPRQKFVSKLIRGAIESITCTNEDAVAIENYNTIEYAEWMEKVETLAELWCIEKDFIRRQQLIGLYQCGYDSIAEECIPLVGDVIATLSTIVAVTAQRLKRHLESCDDPSEWLASVHPQLSRVVEMQELDPSVSSNVPLESTSSFIHKLLTRCDQLPVPEQTHKDIQLLKIVLRGCETITELKL